MKTFLLLMVSAPLWAQFGAAVSVVAGPGAPPSAQCTNANNVGRVWARKDGGAADTTFYVCGATGAGTFGWSLFGAGPSGGAIGGASAVAATQVLYGTAAGVAGSDSLFIRDVANGTFGFGTARTGTISATNPSVRIKGTTATTAASAFEVQDSAGSTLLMVRNNSDIGMLDGGKLFLDGLAGGTYIQESAGLNLVSGYTTRPVRFWLNTEVARFAATTGNLLLNTTTDDGVNKLQVAGSAYARGLTVRNEVVGGSTSLVVRAGDTQGSNNLTTWQNSAGTQVGGINNVGDLTISGQAAFPFSVSTTYYGAGNFFSLDASTTSPFLAFRASGLLQWSGTTSYSGTKDLSLSREATLTLAAGDGGSNSNGYLKSRKLLAGGTASPTILSGFGTTPSIAGKDGAGRITVGTGGVASSGVITFGTAWATAPSCTAQNETTTLLAKATASTTTLTIASATMFGAGDLINWQCIGY